MYRLEPQMEPKESELERFRKEWREEVTKRSHNKARTTAGSSGTARGSSSRTTPAQSTIAAPASDSRRLHRSNDGDDEVAPGGYHDIDQKQTGRTLGENEHGQRPSTREPQTALEHYEKAVEKEGQGSLGDSLNLYRKAFKMDANVDKKYKSKHFPPSAFKPTPASTDPNATGTSAAPRPLTALPQTVAELLADFSELSILGELPPTEFSPAPPCPISEIPDELLTQILNSVAALDVAAFARLARVCKRLAYLVMTEDSVWKQAIHSSTSGLPAMHYRYACTINGSPIEEGTLNDVVDEAPLVSKRTPQIILPLTPSYPSYRQMFRHRPRIRFHGCYISTVNYTRPGGTSSNSLSWQNSVLIVTYYRYLRFFRNGRVISLLTTSEPADVVPYLHHEHVHHNHTGALPQSVMKDALKGRWRLSGDPWKATTNVSEREGEAEVEAEGDVVIETDGVIPKYMYKMHLALASAGKGTRNNKLNWRGFWSFNKLTDDWAAFTLKNDRPYYWSRVKSFGTG